MPERKEETQFRPGDPQVQRVLALRTNTLLGCLGAKFEVTRPEAVAGNYRCNGLSDKEVLLQGPITFRMLIDDFLKANLGLHPEYLVQLSKRRGNPRR